MTREKLDSTALRNWEEHSSFDKSVIFDQLKKWVSSIEIKLTLSYLKSLHFITFTNITFVIHHPALFKFCK